MLSKDIPAGARTADAPGAPGIEPTWCSSAKELVGCALGPSRVWFTIGGGIVNEVYYPRVDLPQIRDLGFIVADGRGFWSEVKRLAAHELSLPAPGVPAVSIVHRHERFELKLRIAPDPRRDVLLLEVELEGDAALRPYVLLAPHLGGTGSDNTVAVAEHRHRRVLWAEQGPFGLALAAADSSQRDAFGRASAGYVGASDGWQDFQRNGAMTWQYPQAGPGNVALTAELPRRAVLALGLASSQEAAATLAISALLQPFEDCWEHHARSWRAWQGRIGRRCDFAADVPSQLRAAYLNSAMVLRTHQDKVYPGAMVASLSVPWGNTRDERGGYHLVWPRDLVECAGALLEVGAIEEARDVLRYLAATQHKDGHWYQNQWLGGRPYWQGVQLDEVAFPVLLGAALAERKALDGIEIADMARRALGFIARMGPDSPQDRWEEDDGLNTFTLAVCIAALVAGADWLAPPAREFALALADDWNAHLEDWTVAYDTPLAKRLGVRGYYVRSAPPQALRDRRALLDPLVIKNRADGGGLRADEQVGVDFLQLVRFGLRRADDPLILDTLRVADALLKVDTPSGPSWHRYNGDGYGEHDDGRAFDGTGRGRAWPLLTGERGHYALAAGEDPLPYLQAMVAMSGDGGMLPEQVWDSAPLPERMLFPGRPTGSAMPLNWAHAEFVKLLASRRLGHACDRPAAAWRRYQGRRPRSAQVFWRELAQRASLRQGRDLVVCVDAPAVIHWGVDAWTEVAECATQDSGLGLHYARLPTAALAPGRRIVFTWRDAASGEWRGRDFAVAVRAREAGAAGSGVRV